MKTLKKLFLVATVCLSAIAVNAQAFDDGKNLLSIGFGFPATSRIVGDLTTYNTYSNYNYKNYGTVVLKFEHGLMKYFGMGLNLEYSSAAVTYDYNQPRPFQSDTTYQRTIKSTVMGFYARLNGHYPIGSNFDIFAGVGLGYLYTLNNDTYTDPNKSGNNYNAKAFNFDAQFTLGLRYMIKDHFGLFAEVGSASTTVQMGITLGF